MRIYSAFLFSLAIPLLSGCFLSYFQNSIYGKDEVIDLSKKGLTKIPDYVFKNKNLKVLKLFRNEIKEIPSAIGELVQLEKLYLGDNELVHLPPEIGRLKNLKILSVAYNRLEDLPSEIGDMTNLQQLWARNNQLEGLPNSIGKLKNLENLQLQFNQLKHLPPTLGDCENMRFMYLNRNNLKELDDNFAKLHNLKELYIANAGPLLTVTEKLCDLRFLEILEIDAYIALPPCLYVLQANRLSIQVR